MKSVLLILISILLFHFPIFSQNDEELLTHHYKNISSRDNYVGEFSTGNTGTGSNINVVYQRCEWTVDPDDATKTLTGKVTIYFSTLISNVSQINFDLNKNSFNNSNLLVSYHGTNCSIFFPSSGNIDIININLPATIVTINTLDSVTINYQGIPPAATSNQIGYQRKVDAAGNNYIYTLSESYEDKDWWPCKADMQDKIDSLDIVVTVPNAFWVAANGAMIDSTINGVTRVFKFKHRYPIASYLVALGIGKYNKYDLGNLTVGSKSVPYILNIFKGKSTATETNILNVMNNHKLVFAALNNLFGDYPFANEKHGFYEFGFSGGMEHQTFSGIGGSSLQSNSILAHELAHQWWGDKATFSTWNHLWLAEGFATYSEVLAAEFVPAIGINPISKLASTKSSARNNTSSSIYLNDITSSNTIWTSSNTTAIYNRGCMVASMLRALMGDNKFFNASKNYLNNTNIAYKSATTNDLQIHMESQFGENMNDFFEEWINKKGTPDYTVLWGNNGNNININLAQNVNSSGSNGIASTHFPMPVVLKISNGSFDTTIVIYHKSTNQLMYSGNGIGSIVNGNTISYNLSFIPTTVSFDPENRTMANGTVSYSTALPINNILLSAKSSNSKLQFELSFLTNELVEKVELQKSFNTNEFNFCKEMIMKTINGEKQNYNAEDKATQLSYYRAKIITDKKYYFSNVISLHPNIENHKILVYPNPAKNIITVQLVYKNNSEQMLQLINSIGEKKYFQKINSISTTIDISHFSKGIYFLQILKDGEIQAVENVIIH